MRNPVVSVLMTAYNREPYVASAIESVLNSFYSDFELIIVDDASGDNTVAIAKDFARKDRRIKVFVNETNLGDYKNRNRAAAYASGKYIKYLDSDDMLYPHGLQVMVYSMEKFPDAGFGVCSKNGDSMNPFPHCIAPRQIYLEHFKGFGHFFRSPGSAIIRKSAFDEVGGFSGKRFVGDLELWFRLGQQFSMVKFQGDLYWSRVHSDSESSFEKLAKTEKMRNELVKSFLLSPDCPIDPKEIRLSFKQRVTKSLRKLIK